MIFGKNPKDKFSRYRDPTGEFSNSTLKTGEWYVAHRILLRNIMIGILVVWGVVSVGYGVVAWGHYIVSGYFADRELARRQIRQFQNYEDIQESYKAVPLNFSPLQIYSSAAAKYDFVTRATNSNERFAIKIRYFFSYDGGKTAEAETLILPKMTVPVAVLGFDSENYPNNPKINIQKISYERISPHYIVRVGEYVEQRLKFSAENIQFVPPTEGVLASRVSFDVTNHSAYEFWEPFFYVEIFSGGEVIGILGLTLPQLKPSEKRTVDLNTFVDVELADDIRLTPMVDVFDRSVYKIPGG